MTKTRLDALSVEEKEWVDTQPGRARRVFFDFVVNGASLYDLCHKNNDSGVPQRGLVGIFGDVFYPNHERTLSQQLQLKLLDEFDPGRVPIFVCCECGDIGCGQISVRVKEESGCFIWSEFRYENGWDDEISGHPEFLHLNAIGPFQFERTTYEELISRVARGSRS